MKVYLQKEKIRVYKGMLIERQDFVVCAISGFLPGI